jgi:hypothetical protein
VADIIRYGDDLFHPCNGTSDEVLNYLESIGLLKWPTEASAVDVSRPSTEGRGHPEGRLPQHSPVSVNAAQEEAVDPMYRLDALVDNEITTSPTLAHARRLVRDPRATASDLKGAVKGLLNVTAARSVPDAALLEAAKKARMALNNVEFEGQWNPSREETLRSIRSAIAAAERQS